MAEHGDLAYCGVERDLLDQFVERSDEIAGDFAVAFIGAQSD